MKVDQAEEGGRGGGGGRGEEEIYHRDTEGTEFRKNSKSDPIPTLCPLCLCGKFPFLRVLSPLRALHLRFGFSRAGKQLGKELPVVTDSNSTIGEMYVFQI